MATLLAFPPTRFLIGSALSYVTSRFFFYLIFKYCYIDLRSAWCCSWSERTRKTPRSTNFPSEWIGADKYLSCVWNKVRTVVAQNCQHFRWNFTVRWRGRAVGNEIFDGRPWNRLASSPAHTHNGRENCSRCVSRWFYWFRFREIRTALIITSNAR